MTPKPKRKLLDDNGQPYPEPIQRLVRHAALVVASKTPNTTYTLAAEINDLENVLKLLGWYE